MLDAPPTWEVKDGVIVAVEHPLECVAIVLVCGEWDDCSASVGWLQRPPREARRAIVWPPVMQ